TVHECDAADRVEDHDAVGRAAQRDGERLHLLAVAVAVAYELQALEGAGDDVGEADQVASVRARDDIVPRAALPGIARPRACVAARQSKSYAGSRRGNPDPR